MKKGIAIIISSIYLLMLPPAIFADNPIGTDTLLCTRDSFFREPLLLYFRYNRSLVDSSYMDNGKSLSIFHALLSNSTAVSLIDTVIITAYASPEGSAAYNNHLTQLRADAVKAYLVRNYPCLEQYRIRTSSQGEDWEGLKRLVTEDTNVPDRAEVLEILNEVKDTHRCKELLKRLNCGYAYQYISKHLLYRLRNAAVCTVKVKKIAPNDPPKLHYLQSSSHRDKLSFARVQSIDSSVTSGVPSVRPLFALKTNLLFDLALAPNIDLELPLGHRWSLNAEWIFPWWLIDNDKYCLQVLSGGLEGRYWLGKRTNRRILTGHFFGLYAGGGKYDLQWKEKGYQGEFYIASGISYGYAMPIARRLNLEFCIGIGLLQTNYKHYRTINNYHTLLWQSNGNYTWFGPTKAKISLVWLLGRKTTKKGGER